MKDNFFPHIQFKVESGSKILFWHNVWVSDSSLAEQFQDLYTCARNGRVKVFDYMERSTEAVVWTPIFRRNLLESKETSLLSLMEIL